MKTIFMLLLLSSVAHAGLEWEQKEIKLSVLPTQVAADAVFRFANKGEAPVTLGEVRVGCGCLSAKPTKRILAPGEQGELKIRFDLENRTGLQRKAVFVETDSGEKAELFVVCDIPESFSIEPRLLTWRQGDQATNKTTRLVNPNPHPIKLSPPTSSLASLPVEMKTIREGFEYEVIVSRNPSAKNARAVIRVQTEPPPGQAESKVLKIYAYAQ
jgi:hypothetical protein